MKQLFLSISLSIVMYAPAQQSNVHFSHTDSTSAPGERIWRIWTDVPNWKQWDKGLKESSLEGEFTAGARGKLSPDKGPKSTFVITEIKPNESYTFKTKIPFGWLVINRTLQVKEGTTYFTHEVQFTGLLKNLFGKKLGKTYRAMLPDVLAAIKQIGEEHDSD